MANTELDTSKTEETAPSTFDETDNVALKLEKSDEVRTFIIYNMKYLRKPRSVYRHKN